MSINGQRYQASSSLYNNSTGYAAISFRSSPTGWVIQQSYMVQDQLGNPGVQSYTLASGQLPAGVTNVTYSLGSPSAPPNGNYDIGNVTNQAKSLTAISGNPYVQYQTRTRRSPFADVGASYPLQIAYYKGNVVTSITNITIIADINGPS
jgi:hypothetical protein